MRSCFFKYRARILLLAALVFSSSAMASIGPCALVGGKSKPVVILLGPDGTIVKKGVDLGLMHYSSDFEAEYLKINTGYKIIVYPRNLFFDTLASGAGYVSVKKILPICAGAAAYEVTLHMNFDKGDPRPYEFKYAFPNVMIEDHPSSPAREANEIYYFKPEVFGTIVQPAK